MVNDEEILMPLKVPEGWAILRNQFVDVDMELNEEGYIANYGYFSSMIMVMRELIYKAGDPVPSGAMIDLAWAPAEDPSGKFRLTLLRSGCWSEEGDDDLHFSSTCRHSIRDTLEKWLDEERDVVKVNRLSEK